MNEEIRNKYLQQTNEVYQEIGKFVVQFELLTHAFQTGIQNILNKSGLVNYNLTNIILADQTAYPLKTILQAMLAEVGNFDDADRAISNAIFKEAGDLIEKRNDVIHSTWFVGWASEADTEFGTTESVKYTKGKLGVGMKSFEFSASDFSRLVAECELVTKKVNRLWSIVFSGKKVSNNFVITGKVISMPPGT